MKKLILGIILAVLIAFNVQTSFGYSVTFEDWGKRIKEIPLVCIMEPTNENHEYLTKKFTERLMKETQWSIGEWESLLKQSERTRDKSMWTINQIVIPLEEQKEFEYDKCYIFINFKDKPELEKDWYKVLGETQYEQGDTGRSDITIYYTEIEFCRTEDSKFYYFDPCYVDATRLMQQMRSVVKHEFGHALGIGHYVTDDAELNIRWARGQITSPSIMSVFTHQNFNDNKISPMDVKKVISLYGKNGFLHEQIEESIFYSFKSSLAEFIIPDGGSILGSLSGSINKEERIVGVPIEIKITLPDETILMLYTNANSEGIFTVERIMDSKTLEGTYSAIASYRNMQSNEITFEIIKEVIEKKEIPQWLKNNAEWYGNDQMTDRDFISGIEYLIKKEIIQVSEMSEQTRNYESEIPDWIRNNAKWWSEGEISDSEYINGMQFLINNGIIKTQFNQ